MYSTLCNFVVVCVLCVINIPQRSSKKHKGSQGKKLRSSIIHIHDEAKKRNYQEFGKSVVDYLNHNVIVEHNQKKFLNDVAKESPAAKAYVNHIEELKNGLAGEDYKAADSLAKVEEDKSIIQ